MKDLEAQVLPLLREIQPAYSFEEGVDFIEQGWLNSFDVVSLVAELEARFSVSISALEIVPENFASVRDICALVRRSARADF